MFLPKHHLFSNLCVWKIFSNRTNTNTRHKNMPLVWSAVEIPYSENPICPYPLWQLCFVLHAKLITNATISWVSSRFIYVSPAAQMLLKSYRSGILLARHRPSPELFWCNNSKQLFGKSCTDQFETQVQHIHRQNAILEVNTALLNMKIRESNMASEENTGSTSLKPHLARQDVSTLVWDVLVKI